MMYSIQKNPAPNVVSGMHFNIDRFKELYNWINATQMDSIATLMQPNRFGLLYSDESSSNFQLQLNDNKVELFRCFGVTPNGSLIAIAQENEPALSISIASLPSPGVYDIMLSVDCNSRSANGIENETEMPKRLPFSIPKYGLDISIQEEKDISKFPSAIKIGELIREGNTGRLNNEYIPACAQVGGHPMLLQKFRVYKEMAGKLYNCFIHVSKMTRSKIDIDITNLHRLSNYGGQFIASHKSVFDAGNKTVPAELFSFFKSLASVLNFHYQSLERQTEFSNLIRSNVENAVGIRFPLNSFREDVHRMAIAEYNSLNIMENFKLVEQFLSIILTNSFEVLSHNNNIVTSTYSPPISGEKTEAPVPEKKVKTSPFDEIF